MCAYCQLGSVIFHWALLTGVRVFHFPHQTLPLRAGRSMVNSAKAQQGTPQLHQLQKATAEGDQTFSGKGVIIEENFRLQSTTPTACGIFPNFRKHKQVFNFQFQEGNVLNVVGREELKTPHYSLGGQVQRQINEEMQKNKSQSWPLCVQQREKEKKTVSSAAPRLCVVVMLITA